MGESRGVYRVLVGNPEGKRPHVRPSGDGRIILKRIFRSGMKSNGLMCFG
jgi:hypothetical protein